MKVSGVAALKQMNIIKAEFESLLKVSELMLEVFHEKMQTDDSEVGRKNFKEQIVLSSLEKRFLNNSLFYIFEDNEGMKGVLELEHPCHISFLFVKREHEGIASALCDTALKNSDEDICTVGAFSPSIGFYKRLGFIEVAPTKIIHEMKFTLMARKTVLD